MAKGNLSHTDVEKVLYSIVAYAIYILTLQKVDTESNNNGGELVADVLKSHGVKFVYTLVGGHVSPILVAAEKRGIRVVDTRHEVSQMMLLPGSCQARCQRTVSLLQQLFLCRPRLYLLLMRRRD